MTETTLLTVREVSKMLGVHVNTVRAMAEDGRLNGVKTKGENGHWRFKLIDVKSFSNTYQNNDIESILKDILYILDDIPSTLIGEGAYSNEKLWAFVNRYYGIRNVFGSYCVHAEMDKYRDIIDKKGFIWLGEGAVNFMEALNDHKNKNEFHTDKILSHETEFAFGVVKYPTPFGEDGYSLVPLLVVKDKQDKKWVVDGTLQQFYPNLKKGLAVLPVERAKDLYIGLEIHSKKRFAELYSDPFVSERYVQQAREWEKA